MKKIVLLISVLVLILVLCACQNNASENLETSGETEVTQMELDNTELNGEETNDVTNQTFEERTKEAKEYIHMQDEYGIDAFGNGSYYCVSKASLEKVNNFYVMKLHYNSPKLYSKADIENACNLAQDKGTYSLGEYTFYRGNDIPMNLGNEENDEYTETIKSAVNGRKENTILAKYDFGEVEFKPTPNDESIYYITHIQWILEYLNYVISEETKTKNVILLPEDKILIVPTNLHDMHTDLEGKEMSVEEFYIKAINHEVSIDELINGYEYDLDDIGDDMGLYTAYANAVDFDDEYVIVNYKNGGI